MPTFYPGDRVRALGMINSSGQLTDRFGSASVFPDETGTILPRRFIENDTEPFNDNSFIAVEWDTPHANRHSHNGRVAEGYGYNVLGHSIQLLREEDKKRPSHLSYMKTSLNTKHPPKGQFKKFFAKNFGA